MDLAEAGDQDSHLDEQQRERRKARRRGEVEIISAALDENDVVHEMLEEEAGPLTCAGEVRLAEWADSPEYIQAEHEDTEAMGTVLEAVAVEEPAVNPLLEEIRGKVSERRARQTARLEEKVQLGLGLFGEQDAAPAGVLAVTTPVMRRRSRHGVGRINPPKTGDSPGSTAVPWEDYLRQQIKKSGLIPPSASRRP